MKIIINEQQSGSLLQEMLDDIFNGYEMKFEGEGRNVYVDGQLLMTINPTSAIIDKSILNKINDIFFFQTSKDMKDEIRNWININFGIKKTAEKLLGIKFQNFTGEEEPPQKEKKKPQREKKPPKEKKSEEQIRREREGYSNFLKYKKEFENKLKEYKNG